MRWMTTCFFTLFISTPATANWCDGTRWMFTKMPMETRVTEAIADLDALAIDLLAEKKRLKNKVSVNSRSLRKQLTEQYTELKELTVMLCKSPKKSSFPFSYQQIILRSTADYRHQLSLNLGLLSSQRQMIEALNEEERGFKQHIQQLMDYRNQALLLNQQTKIQQRSPVSSLQFIQQACQLKQRSSDELEQTREILIRDVLEQRLESLQQPSVDEEALGDFIKHCKLAPIQQQIQVNTSWWRALY